MQILGEGSFGKVKLHSDSFVVKIPKKPNQLIDDAYQFNEIHLLSNLRSPFVIGGTGMSKEGMIMEKAYPNIRRLFALSNPSMRRLFISSIFKGIYDLHRAGFYHCDLSMTNIMYISVKGRCVAKIIDLGGCSYSLDDTGHQRILESSEPITTWTCASYNKCVKPLITYKTDDVWAAGMIILFLMVNEDFLFPEAHKSYVDNLAERKRFYDTYLNAEVVKANIEKWTEYYEIANKDDFLDLMTKVFEFDPLKRISVGSIMRHPFMYKLNNFENDLDIPRESPVSNKFTKKSWEMIPYIINTMIDFFTGFKLKEIPSGRCLYQALYIYERFVKKTDYDCYKVLANIAILIAIKCFEQTFHSRDFSNYLIGRDGYAQTVLFGESEMWKAINAIASNFYPFFPNDIARAIKDNWSPFAEPRVFDTLGHVSGKTYPKSAPPLNIFETYKKLRE